MNINDKRIRSFKPSCRPQISSLEYLESKRKLPFRKFIEKSFKMKHPCVCIITLGLFFGLTITSSSYIHPPENAEERINSLQKDVNIISYLAVYIFSSISFLLRGVCFKCVTASGILYKNEIYSPK